MKAAIMLPTYNEAGNITKIVEAILGLGSTVELKELGLEKFLIVIVDDSSPDGTGAIAEELGVKYPGRIHVIHRSERGRGSAGIAGFKYILTQDIDYIIEMDADYSHNPADIPRLLKEATKFDIVIGSRRISGGNMGQRDPFRGFISLGASIYARMMLGWGIKEWHSGYKCYRKKVLQSLDFDKFRSHGYSIGMETVYRAVKNGFNYKEIPIIFTERTQGSSKFSKKEIRDYFKLVWQIRFERKYA
jgi:dolichol-phosphate mannosyltransferase